MGRRDSQNKQAAGRIDFMGASAMFTVISVILTIGALVAIGIKGFNYGIDFAGGTEVQVKFEQPVQTSQVRQFTDDMGFNSASVQSFGEGENEYLIRLETVEGKTDKETNEKLDAMISQITSGLGDTFAQQGAAIRRVDSVGPQIGSELKRNGILAAFYSLILILIYIGLRFDYKYSPAAVFCLFHDAILTLGIFALFNREVNVQTMAAILTVIGYSLNDTIVNFDRIRENLTIYRDNSLRWVINRSLNEVLSRTILTSVTTLLAVGALYFIAGGVIQDFAFTLGIGVLIGTYSSIYVAAPLVLLIDRMQYKKSVA